MSEPTTDTGLREQLAEARARALRNVRAHLDEIFSDWDRLNVPQVAATYELLRCMTTCDSTEPDCGVPGCGGDCEAAEAVELATELAEERILHQQTMDDRDRLAAEAAQERDLKEGQRAKDAEARLARVRALHVRVDGGAGPYCELCADGGDIHWPCATIAALDGTGEAS
jgi:hypothetical protein